MDLLIKQYIKNFFKEKALALLGILNALYVVQASFLFITTNEIKFLALVNTLAMLLVAKSALKLAQERRLLKLEILKLKSNKT